ncbi:MAG: hypothetical protein IJN16_02710 [Lachnospiraceae bacterium]|nr:hypothetical protein [Lachnospiraceae bacterium]
MKEIAYRVFVDIWRLTCKYGFRKLEEEQWERFIDDADYLYKRYKGTKAEGLYRQLLLVVTSFYEELGKGERV